MCECVRITPLTLDSEPEPVWEGSAALVSAEQRSGIVSALRRDSEGALKRRYPQATFVPVGTPGAVRVTPAIVAPSALVPWAKLTVRLDLDLPSGNRASLSENFGLLFRREIVVAQEMPCHRVPS